MDTKNYIEMLMATIGGLMSLVGFLVWRILHRIEEKLEELHRMSHNCRESLIERFTTRKENAQIQIEIDEIWETINYHEHDQSGRTIR
jgi:hypothetical protein